MIAYIKGEVLEVNDDNVIILAGGLGYQVFAPIAGFSVQPKPGEELALYTYMQLSTQLKAEGVTLFGFAEKRELRLFNMLLGVSGVGAKTALAALNNCGYAGIVSAVQMGDAKALMVIPGVGKKAAERILLELKDKIMKLEPEFIAPAPPPKNDLSANVKRTAVLALTQLGYPQATAQKYVDGVYEQLPEGAELEEIITAALQLAARG
jgi:Holliday junction DNA helicase RuvA